MFYLKALHKLFADVCKTMQAIVLLLVMEHMLYSN